MAEQGEPRSSVHLPLDHFGLGIDSLGPAVVEGQGECRCRGLDVQVQSTGEGVGVRQVSGAGRRDSLLQARGAARFWGEEAREVADEAGQGGHLGVLTA